MKSKTQNIAFFALFHLFLFATPFIAKALHHDEQYETCLPGIVASKEDHCIICNFEFVAFKHTACVSEYVSSHENTVDIPGITEEVFLPSIIYFTLRAPPQF